MIKSQARNPDAYHQMLDSDTNSQTTTQCEVVLKITGKFRDNILQKNPSPMSTFIT